MNAFGLRKFYFTNLNRTIFHWHFQNWKLNFITVHFLDRLFEDTSRQYFEGATKFVKIFWSPSLTPTRQLSIEVWIYEPFSEFVQLLQYWRSAININFSFCSNFTAIWHRSLNLCSQYFSNMFHPFDTEDRQ